jgi:hypothetical protein
MEGRISTQTRRELVKAVGSRYRAATRTEKRVILDEFVAVTGYHRKHAIRLLVDGTPQEGGFAPRRTQRRLYDKAVQEALVVLWEASDRVCGKRLKPLLPLLISSLERHGHLQLDPLVRGMVVAASAATIDRLLAETRSATRGGKPFRRAAAPGIRRQVPVRTFADWKEPQPGFMEADLVAHCGGSAAGSFVHTLTLTDVASGWTECSALIVRDGTLVVEALERLRMSMPFPLRGFDTDNGSEFVNDAVLAYCEAHGIEFTRSRPYRKNDQAWVEQKNGSVVRRLIGYGRLEGIVSAQALAGLYSASRLFVNFFQPSFKLAEKRREGSRITKRHHPPETPCARLLASPALSEAIKERLAAVQAALDPLQLLDEIRAAQEHLAQLVAGERVEMARQVNPDLGKFLSGLATAWREGEVRPTHRPKPRPKTVRYWRTRKDPFRDVWSQVLAWLETEPERSGTEVFDRLRSEHPGAFTDGQLRTLQRKLKSWRSETARRLVFGSYDLAISPVEGRSSPGNIPGEASGNIGG